MKGVDCMECLGCGEKITEGKLCNKCTDEKNKSKQNIKTRAVLMVFAICLFFLTFFLATIIKNELIQKALTTGTGVSAFLLFFSAMFAFIRSYIDYKHFCDLELKNNIQLPEDGEINEDALQKYLSNRKPK